MTPAEVIQRRAELAEVQRRALLDASDAGVALTRLDEDEPIYDADAIHEALVSVGEPYDGSVEVAENYVRCILGGGTRTHGPWTRGEVKRAVTVVWQRGATKVLDGCDAVIRAREEMER